MPDQAPQPTPTPGKEGGTPSPQSPPQNNAKAGEGGKPPEKGGVYENLIEGEPKGGMWPEDWRKQFSFGDEATAKRWERFDSPAAMAKSYLALDQRIRSGEFKRSTPLAEDATPEQVTAWREENGIPTEATAYEVVPAGEELDPASKAFVDVSQGAFLKANLTQAQAKILTDALSAHAQQGAQAEAEAHADARDACDNDLRATWGPEFRNNIETNRAHMTKMFGEELGMALLTQARLADGRRLGDIPEFSKVINQWARAEGSDMLVAGEGRAAHTVDSRIAEIEKIMSTDMNKYTPAMRTEYGKLIEKREARGQR